MHFIHPSIEKYITELNKSNDPQLDVVKKSSEKEAIPIVDHDVGKFLFLLILIMQPKNVLEIGFGGGYSTLWMAKALGDKGKITSLELNSDRIKKGEKIFKEFNFLSKLELIYIDALKFLEDTEDTYDFIFLDGIKRSYITYLPLIQRVINKKGVFIADNILFRGNVVKKDVGTKYQMGTSVIKEFNKSLSDSPHFETLFLPIGDGLSYSVKL